MALIASSGTDSACTSKKLRSSRFTISALIVRPFACAASTRRGLRSPGRRMLICGSVRLMERYVYHGDIDKCNWLPYVTVVYHGETRLCHAGVRAVAGNCTLP